MHRDGGHAAVAVSPINSRWSRAGVRIGTPLGDALREHWRSATWLALAAAATLATLSPVLTVRSPGILSPSAIRAVDEGIAWSATAQEPAALQADTIGRLLLLLLVVACASCAVAAISAVVVQWTRSGMRGLDTAVRRAVGASRRDIALSLLLEGSIIALSAIPLGLAIGYGALRAALFTWPGAVGHWAYAPATIGIVTAAALLLSALLPLRLAHGRLVNLPPNPLGLVPAVVQIGASMAILLAATLVSRQATMLLTLHDTVAEGTVYQLADDTNGPEARSADYADLLLALEKSPEVKGASLMSPGTLVGLGTVDWMQIDCGQCFTGGMFVRWQDERVTHHLASPDTFRVLGIPLVSGRAFTLQDGWNAPRVAIVNRQMAARHFENGQPLGRMIYVGKARVPYTVIGVVEDGAAPGFAGGVQPRFAVYLSSLQHPIASADLLVRGGPAARQQVEVLLARRTLTHDAGTLEAEVRRAFTRPMTWFGRWFRAEAMAALLIGALGVMVSLSLWASALVPELAVRRALGATRRRITLGVLAQALLIVAAGIVLALGAIGPSFRAVLAEILGDLPPLPLGDVLLPAVVLLVAAMLGAVRPLQRAIRSEPAALLGE